MFSLSIGRPIRQGLLVWSSSLKTTSNVFNRSPKVQEPRYKGFDTRYLRKSQGLWYNPQGVFVEVSVHPHLLRFVMRSGRYQRLLQSFKGAYPTVIYKIYDFFFYTD